MAIGASRPNTGLRRFTASESGARFEPWQAAGAQQGLAHILGQLPSAATFGFERGGTGTEFTDIPQSAYLTPGTLSQMQNALFAEGAARTGAQQEQIREGALPGATSRFGLSEMLAGPQRFNDAVAQRESTRLAGEYSPTINRLAAQAQTNVEAQRALDARTLRALGVQREGGLLAALGNFTNPLPYSAQYRPQYRVGYGGHQGFQVG